MLPSPSSPLSALRLCLAVLLPACATLRAQPAPQDNWTLDRVVTVSRFGNALMDLPYAATPLSDGRIAVVEHRSHRIQILDANGNSVVSWGNNGSGNGQFSNPWSIAELKDGSLAVSDHSSHRIQVFTKEGAFLRKWGGQGSADGQLYYPCGLLVLADGNLLVCDRYNDRVQIFDPSGNYVRKWSVPNGPSGAVLLSEGRIAVTCVNDRTVKVYNPDGTFVRQFGASGTGDGQFSANFAIAVLPDGKVVVSEYDNHRIQVLYPDGSFVRKWGQEGSADGQFRNPIGVSVAPDGRILVADAGNNRIQIFNADGVFQGKFGTYGTGGDAFNEIRLIDSDNDGNLVVLTRGGPKPHFNLISPAGQVLRRFDFNRAHDCYPMFRAGNGKIYVGYGSHFEVYRPDGSLELTVGTPGGPSAAPGQFGGGWVLPVPDAEGNIYAGDVGNGRVQKFSSTGTLLLSFGEPGTGPGQLSLMRSIGISPDGSVMVHVNTPNVLRFSPAGVLLEVLSHDGSDWGEPSVSAYAADGFYFKHAHLFRPERVRSLAARGYNVRKGEFYRVDGTNRIEVWRRGFRTLGGNPAKLVPAPGIAATKQRANGLVDLDYSVTDADSATVTTALVAYRGGSTLIKDLVPLRADTLVEGTAAKVGAGIATGATHRVTWNPATAGLFSGDLVFEALARDDRPGLLDLDFITLPTTPALTISRTPLLNADFRAVWAWLLATGDPALTRAADGEVVGPGGTFTSTSGTETRTTFPGRAWLFAKLGVREATFDEIQKARLATATSGSPNRFTPGAAQKMGELPKALNEWTFDSGDYGSDAWWVVPSP